MRVRAGILLILFTAVCVRLSSAQQSVKTANLTFTTIDVPGATYTFVTGINLAGDMVGFYETVINQPNHAFLFRNGQFTFFDYPGASGTSAWGINDSGLIVGYAELHGGAEEVGFLYDGTTFTIIRDGKNSATVGWGINNARTVVGGTGTVFTTKGFVERGKTFKNLSPPGTYVYVYATGVNNLGEVAGWTDYDGFSFSNGKFTIMDFPGATKTEALGINDRGIIVGWYSPVGPSLFAFAFTGGKYTSFGYPGALYTAANGISLSGQAVGEYTFDGNIYHGFVTSPITDADFQ